MDEMRRQYRSLTVEQAYVKLRYYCAFQERTHQEVKMKTRGLGIAWSDIDGLVSKLIEEGFLNEERFAGAFVRGKFRIKKWGRKNFPMEAYDLAFKTRLYVSKNHDKNYQEKILKQYEDKTNSIR